MKFTYSFPPLRRLRYDVITAAVVADEEYVPGTWSELPRRCMEGLFKVEEGMCLSMLLQRV